MKKSGILNGRLNGLLTDVRHGDGVVICDMGFPIPKGSTVVDLSLVQGIPTFAQVMKVLLDDMCFESIHCVEFLPEANPKYYEIMKKTFVKQDWTFLSMKDFVEKSKEAKVIIRTGEPLFASNVYLTSCSGDPWSNNEYGTAWAE